MTTIEFLSATRLWISASRHLFKAGWTRSRRSVVGFSGLVALTLMGLCVAGPSSAHHARRHRPMPPPPARHGEWLRPHPVRTPSVYAEIEAGFAALPDADVHGPFVDGDLNLDPGFVTGGALAAQLTPFLRLEGAMSYREAQVDRFFVEGFVNEDEGHFGAYSRNEPLGSYLSERLASVVAM